MTSQHKLGVIIESNMIIKKEKSYQKMSTLKVGHLNMYAQMKIKLERFRWFFLLEILADFEDVQYI